MSPKPTLGAFIDKAVLNYGCELKETRLPVMGPKGPVTWKYLKRGELVAPLPDIHDDEELTAANMRSLVAQLNLPALEFGFEL